MGPSFTSISEKKQGSSLVVVPSSTLYFTFTIDISFSERFDCSCLSCSIILKKYRVDNKFEHSVIKLSTTLWMMDRTRLTQFPFLTGSLPAKLQSQLN